MAAITTSSFISDCDGMPVAGLTEREGFEPSRELLAPYSLSRRVPSAARPPLRGRRSPERPRGTIVGWIGMTTTQEKPTPVPPVDEETRPVSAIDTPTPLPLPTPLEAHERFESIFGGRQAPFAFL